MWRFVGLTGWLIAGAALGFCAAMGLLLATSFLPDGVVETLGEWEYTLQATYLAQFLAWLLVFAGVARAVVSRQFDQRTAIAGWLAVGVLALVIWLGWRWVDSYQEYLGGSPVDARGETVSTI